MAMAATTQHPQSSVGTAGQGLSGAISRHDGQPMGARLTTDQVWRALSKASFAILGYVTPSGEPRSSGVVYKIAGRRLYIAVAPDSWKARHIAATGRVAVTVPVRRGGILSLVAPIPPATVSFHAMAIVHPAGSPQAGSVMKALGSLVPAERQVIASIIEVVPEGEFVTYAVGVPLRTMRDPAKARARVPVSQVAGPR
jgi:hypothetical protein